MSRLLRIAKPLVVGSLALSALTFSATTAGPDAERKGGSVGEMSLADTRPAAGSWKLWGSDEFNAASGSLPNWSVWSLQTGGSGWGNNELQTYTARSSNISHNGKGQLAITARKEMYRGADGITRNWTSAKMTSKIAFRYGKLEARMLLPAGQGLWPAFWTVGSDITWAGWPKCGEIDVMESINTMAAASGTLHGATSTGAWKKGGSIRPVDGLAWVWHTYAVEWWQDSITWTMDGTPYATVTKASLPSGWEWPFTKQHVVQFNLAVGGNWPGSPDATTPSVSTMLVDWVRIYQWSTT